MDPLGILFVFFFVQNISAAKIYKVEFALRIFEKSVLRAADVMWCEYIECLTEGLEIAEFFVKNEQTTKLFQILLYAQQ